MKPLLTALFLLTLSPLTANQTPPRPSASSAAGKADVQSLIKLYQRSMLNNDGILNWQSFLFHNRTPAERNNTLNSIKSGIDQFIHELQALSLRDAEAEAMRRRLISAYTQYRQALPRKIATHADFEQAQTRHTQAARLIDPTIVAFRKLAEKYGLDAEEDPFFQLTP